MQEKRRKMEMRVLYVISTLEGGGAESQLCSYAIEQKKLYPDVCFEICAIKKGGVFEKKLKEKKRSLENIRCTWLKWNYYTVKYRD